MPQRFIEPLTLFLMALALVAGALGGGAVASGHLMRGKKSMRLAMAVAYVFVGSALGLIFYGFGHVIGWDTSTPESVTKGALIFSIAGTIMITSKDFGMRWTLERFGIGMRVEFFRKDDDK